MKPPSTGPLLATTFIILMFLPRAVTEGMFMDGTIYAAIARNMSLGLGGLWEPWYHPLTADTPVFHIHPPLQFWLQCTLMKMLGTAWWVEKIYGFFILVVTVVLIRWVWRLLFRTDEARRDGAWAAVLFWYAIPSVHWAAPNNMLDSTMSVFCLLATGCSIIGMNAERRAGAGWLVLAGLSVFAGVLTKGPVGLFPLTAPFLYAWTVLKRPLWAPEALLPSAVAAFCGLLLWQYPPAAEYVKNYWQIQLKNPLSGMGHMAENGVWGRFYVFKVLAVECAPLIIPAVLLSVFRKKSALLYRSPGLLFLILLLCCAVVPMLLSVKQRSFYLVPAFAVAGMAAAAVVYPGIRGVLSGRLKTGLSISLFLMITSVLGYSAYLAGKPGREKNLLEVLHAMKGRIPERESLYFCPDIYTDYATQAYLQRYGAWEVNTDYRSSRFALIRTNSCGYFEERGWSTIFRNAEYKLCQKIQ